MSSPNVLRWAIAAPCAIAVGVAIAFGSWHFRDTDFLKHVRGDSASSQAGPVSETENRVHSGDRLAPAAGSSTALPSLTQGALVTHEDPLPTREAFAAMLEQEKSKAAHEALTSYILSNEERAKLDPPPGQRPPDHPLVEELINKPNAMRGVAGGMVPGTHGNGGLGFGGYPQHVLRDAAQMFSSPSLAPLQSNAKATTDMTLSALMRVQGELKSRLEGGSGGSLGNLLGLEGSHLLTNALAGSSGDGSGLARGAPFVGSYMTPPVGSPSNPVVAGVDSSELAAATALVEEYRRLLPSLSDAEMKEYLRRVDTEGKVAAMLWVVRTKQAAK